MEQNSTKPNAKKARGADLIEQLQALSDFGLLEYVLETVVLHGEDLTFVSWNLAQMRRRRELGKRDIPLEVAARNRLIELAVRAFAPEAAQ